MSVCFHFRMLHGPLTRYVRFQVAHASGMAGTFSPSADFEGNRLLAIPACITARASRTCRNVCRDRLPAVAGKTFPAFPAHAHPQFYVSGKRPITSIVGIFCVPVSYPHQSQTSHGIVWSSLTGLTDIICFAGNLFASLPCDFSHPSICGWYSTMNIIRWSRVNIGAHGQYECYSMSNKLFECKVHSICFFGLLLMKQLTQISYRHCNS